MSDLKPMSWDEILKEVKGMRLYQVREFILDHDPVRSKRETSMFIVNANNGRGKDESVTAVRVGRKITIDVHEHRE